MNDKPRPGRRGSQDGTRDNSKWRANINVDVGKLDRVNGMTDNIPYRKYSNPKPSDIDNLIMSGKHVTVLNINYTRRGSAGDWSGLNRDTNENESHQEVKVERRPSKKVSDLIKQFNSSPVNSVEGRDSSPEVPSKKRKQSLNNRRSQSFTTRMELTTPEQCQRGSCVDSGVVSDASSTTISESSSKEFTNESIDVQTPAPPLTAKRSSVVLNFKVRNGLLDKEKPTSEQGDALIKDNTLTVVSDKNANESLVVGAKTLGESENGVNVQRKRVAMPQSEKSKNVKPVPTKRNKTSDIHNMRTVQLRSPERQAKDASDVKNKEVVEARNPSDISSNLKAYLSTRAMGQNCRPLSSFAERTVIKVVSNSNMQSSVSPVRAAGNETVQFSDTSVRTVNNTKIQPSIASEQFVNNNKTPPAGTSVQIVDKNKSQSTATTEQLIKNNEIRPAGTSMQSVNNNKIQSSDTPKQLVNYNETDSSGRSEQVVSNNNKQSSCAPEEKSLPNYTTQLEPVFLSSIPQQQSSKEKYFEGDIGRQNASLQEMMKSGELDQNRSKIGFISKSESLVSSPPRTKKNEVWPEIKVSAPSAHALQNQRYTFENKGQEIEPTQATTTVQTAMGKNFVTNSLSNSAAVQPKDLTDLGSKKLEYNRASDRINTNLNKLKSELMAFREQDLALLKQLIYISQTIQKISRAQALRHSKSLSFSSTILNPRLYRQQTRVRPLVRQNSAPHTVERRRLLFGASRSNTEDEYGSTSSFEESEFDSQSELDESTSSLSSLYPTSPKSPRSRALPNSRFTDVTLCLTVAEDSDISYDDILKRNVRLWKMSSQRQDPVIEEVTRLL